MLNLIELERSGLKDFMRKHNTSFQFLDIPHLPHLAKQWISALTADDSNVYTDHILKIKETFKKSDRVIEQIEEDIIDEDDDDVSLGMETADALDWHRNAFLNSLSYF